MTKISRLYLRPWLTRVLTATALASLCLGGDSAAAKSKAKPKKPVPAAAPASKSSPPAAPPAAPAPPTAAPAAPPAAKPDPFTVTTLFAAVPSQGYADGGSGKAQFDLVSGSALGGRLLFLADKQNHAVRVLDLASLQVSTLLGGRDKAGWADGSFADARLGQISGICLSGENLYVTESEQRTIRRIDLRARTVTTLAGTANERGNRDGVGAAARLEWVKAPVVSGNMLYFIDSWRIRSLDLTTLAVKTIAGPRDEECNVGVYNVCPYGVLDGVGNAARFEGPSALAVHGDTLYIADNIYLRTLDLPSVRVTTVIGSKTGKPVDGVGTQVSLVGTTAVLSSGNKLMLAEDGIFNRLRMVDLATFRVMSLTGQKYFLGGSGDKDGPAAEALFEHMVNVHAYSTMALVVERSGTIRAFHLQ
jgi:hypothetical protein